MMSKRPTQPEATGERLIPEQQHGEVVHAEHLARYYTAAQLAGSRRVLDVACGEGYGTAILADSGAAAATGVDIAEGIVEHARSRHPNARFSCADVRELPFADGSFDLVVSFETIEHVRDPERALRELKRVMADDGILLISTPNTHQYLVENEFHEREFSHEDFVDFLSSCFDSVSLLLQHNWLTAAVLPPEIAADASGDREHELAFRKVAGIEPGGELYTVALCGRGTMPAVRPVAVTAKVDEAQELARRTVDAERAAQTWHEEYETAERTAKRWYKEYKAAEQTAKDWHDEYTRAERILLGVYGSVWWRMTAPLRWLVNRARRRSG